MNAPAPAVPPERRFAVRFLGRWNFWVVLPPLGVAAALCWKRPGGAGERQRACTACSRLRGDLRLRCASGR
jgi:hypothetical protein